MAGFGFYFKTWNRAFESGLGREKVFHLKQFFGTTKIVFWLSIQLNWAVATIELEWGKTRDYDALYCWAAISIFWGKALCCVVIYCWRKLVIFCWCCVSLSLLLNHLFVLKVLHILSTMVPFYPYWRAFLLNNNFQLIGGYLSVWYQNL